MKSTKCAGFLEAEVLSEALNSSHLNSSSIFPGLAAYLQIFVELFAALKRAGH